jgi:(p)ppGpp synthase/HD superfamily hydrolase
MRRLKAPDHVVAAAYLHDAVEDGHTNFVELHGEFEFPVMMVALVRALTRRETETYDQYIERVARNPEASTIKRADLADNMSTLPSGHALWNRYLKAMVRLHNA